MNRKRGELYRNAEQGKIAGVCAGIADYFGWETWLVRILVVSGVLFGMPFLILGYIAGWFILDKSPEKIVKGDQGTSRYANSSQQGRQEYDVSNESIKVKARIWQAGEPPKQALYDIGRKFRSLEKKVQAMEQYVTSAEFTVSREINKL
ncbi:MAG: envelope stress response membrane protein PspC [Colwellia sp.]|uniref:envelope stress response membrane protein PspC n=1 Tax=Colwellia sp. TaxID=56799 RepID=UPI001DC2D270|nr:envelope stress response membrane protein PspC [Colwellia sp.]NQY47612.1 envelope stress response membrane protein PspC [Colwellia sp.]NQZ24792.1 envelope stress response membrane protein PspC [Colwellia sp.]